MKPDFAPYHERPIRFREIWQHGEWRLKVYTIASGRSEPRGELVEAAKAVAAETLEAVSPTVAHYSVGFLGIHDGKTANFVFVDWWADENELHHHVFTSPCGEPARLQDATPTGVIACVWDLRLMAFERDAWVGTVLRGQEGGNLEAYLNRQLNEDA